MYDFNQLVASIWLSDGSHKSPDEGVCAMELVALLEGLEHTDHPPCTCPVIAAYVRTFNDRLPDEKRQGLIKYIPRLVGTVSPQHEQERSEYLAWQAITVITPNAMEQIGLMEHAQKLRSVPFHDWATARAAAYAAASAAAYAHVNHVNHVNQCHLGFDMLDGVLSIGPSGAFSEPQDVVAKRAEKYKSLVSDAA